MSMYASGDPTECIFRNEFIWLLVKANLADHRSGRLMRLELRDLCQWMRVSLVVTAVIHSVAYVIL